MELDRYDFILIAATMTAFAIIGLHHLPMWVLSAHMRGPRSGVLKTPLREIRLRAERRQKAINSHKKGGKPQQLAASRNRSRETGEPYGTVRLDQPRVTTGGGGALPFPQMAHPLTPMARTIEQTAIRNFFMTLPVCTQCVCTASKSLSGCISATYSKLRLWSWVELMELH